MSRTRNRHDLTAIASATFLAKDVDHCRAGVEAHRTPVESFCPEHLVARGREHPNSLTPALMLISETSESYEMP